MKKFWQNLIVWQKAAIFVFLFLSLVFIMVFLNVPRCLKQNLRSFKSSKKAQNINVEIIIDKTQYKQGEKITGRIQNNLNKKASFYIISIVAPMGIFYEEKGEYGWEEKGKDSWEEVRYDIECPCDAKCSKVPIALAPGSYRNFSGDLKDNYCKDIPAGKYKINVNWQAGNESGYSYSNEFTIIDDNLVEETEECKEDTDCKALFYNCDCNYHCVSKNEKKKDCDNECKMLLPPKQPECVCSNNKCIEADECDKLKSEIHTMIKNIQYCESDSDCVLDETTHLSCPFGHYLITGIYNSDKNIAVTSIQNKIEEYSNKCGACEYEMPIAPKPEDIKCQNNQCVDARFSSFKESGAQESESIVERLNRLNAQGELTAEDQGWEVEQKCYGLESINDCEKINWPMKCGCRTDGKYECYRCFAELEKNADYCGKIEEEFWMDNCYWAVAVQLRDAGEQDKIDFCDKMAGVASHENQKGACFEIAKERI